LDEKGGKLLKKTFVGKDLRGDLNCRPGIGTKQLSVGGRNDAGLRGNFEYLESNMIDKHANEDSSILSSDMYNEDI